jgi:hypothetical protein
MIKLIFVGLFVLTACGGSLSEDQRRKLHEGMANQKIVRLSDSEILTASLDRGRIIFSALEKFKFDPLKVDSISRQYNARIHWIVPGSRDALEVENQLIEAYVIGAETGSTQDNIQKLRQDPQSEEYDSLLYSRPIVTPMPDGVVNVEGVWNIYFAKKDLILSVGKKD